MMGLLVYKEKLKNFYAEHEFYVNPIIKFISAFIALTLIKKNVGVNLKYKSNIISKIITTNAPSSIDNVNMLIHIIAVKAVIIIVQGIKAIITDIPIITGHIVNKSLYPTFFFIRI